MKEYRYKDYYVTFLQTKESDGKIVMQLPGEVPERGEVSNITNNLIYHYFHRLPFELETICDLKGKVMLVTYETYTEVALQKYIHRFTYKMF